jgi:hypothetical protein
MQHSSVSHSTDHQDYVVSLAEVVILLTLYLYFEDAIVDVVDGETLKLGLDAGTVES